MNRIKVREWYRPVAPMVAIEHAPRVYAPPQDSFESPYMSFAMELL